jgi:hypothetical protein
LCCGCAPDGSAAEEKKAQDAKLEALQALTVSQRAQQHPGGRAL